MIFLQDQTIIPATVADPGVDLSGYADARAPVGDALRSHHPDPARAVIQFINAAAERAIAISHRSDEPNLFIVIMRRVLIDFGNICLAGTSDHRQRPRENGGEKKASAKYMHRVSFTHLRIF